MPPPLVNLFPKGAFTGPGHGIVVPSQPPSELAQLPGENAGRDAKTEEERVMARMGAVGIDAKARSRVKAGLADPSYTRIGRAFLRAWDPDRALPDTSAELWAKNRARNVVIASQLWQEAGSNYGKNGSPIARGETLDDEDVRSDLRPLDSPLAGVDAQHQRDTYGQYMQGKFNAGRSARVLVRQRGDGRIEVSLVQSSGDMTVDRAALDDVRSAMSQLQKDDPEFQKPRTSVWLMRLQILINPPVPVAGITFDQEMKLPRLELPLGRRLFKHVELEAVYDADQPAAASKP
jgi:hypothetical protein